MISFLYGIFFFICLFYVYTCLLARKYQTPYKVYVIFGRKGVGKSADICKRALHYQKKGYRTFCSEKDVSCCEYFDPLDFGKFSCPKSVIFLDEAGVLYHKRDFADKTRSADLKRVRTFVKWSRHEEMIVFIYSQNWDIDLSIKEAADCLYLYKKYFSVITVGKRIDKSIVLTQPDADRPGAMADSFKFDPFWIPGSRVYNFIPRYAKYYNSYKKLGLPSYEQLYGLPVVREVKAASDDTDAGTEQDDAVSDVDIKKEA